MQIEITLKRNPKKGWANIRKKQHIDRVGKCHGYDGYIRVKKLASWGKKFGRPK